MDACLGCHNDAHSLAYTESSHFELWQNELARRTEPGTGVSCATCHLPRIEHTRQGHSRVLVQHNQNDNLRPNEKMIRSVCLHCHGFGFSLDALADAALIRTNFIGRPSRHVESIDMALRRRVETETKKSKGLKP
jgi:formate-dependent nitrite reductase cytochrome c552 subunit